MSDSTTAKCLETFPAWLRTLGEDAERLAELLESSASDTAAREAAAGGLNYLFKSLDLIPDGIDDIGYLDDAFVLRVAADLALRGDAELPGVRELAADCDLLREFLGADYGRLEGYVKGLRSGAARGRAVSDILGQDSIRAEFVADVHGFAKSYSAPSFGREEKNLIKLKAFFDAKLPR